jgi:hypothetical protein
MKQSMPENMPFEASIARVSIRAAMVSVAHTVTLLLATSCGFPRPPDVGSDASGDTGGGPAGPGSAIRVSPSGDDSNDGLISPVKTLKHAVGLAAANTQISQIVLTSGTYSMSSGETCRFSAAMDPAFSKPFPPGFLRSHDSRSVADPPLLCPVVLAKNRLTRAKPLFVRAAKKRARDCGTVPCLREG